MANTATRLFNLISLLQRQPNQSASELAEALNVSVRTIQRYIVMLEEIGVPVYAERGAQGGYSLVRGYRMPPLTLSPDEAVAVYLGTTLIENVWGKLFRNQALAAMAKIENALPPEQLQEIAWARSTLITRDLPKPSPTLDTEQFETLYQAVRQSMQVEILYLGRGQRTPTRRRIDPYVLTYSWGQQYCISYCHLRNAMRSFRVDRILALEPLAIRFSKPDSFDPAQYLDETLKDQPVHQVQLRFPSRYAYIAQDYRCCWESFEEQSDGSILASFYAADLEMAAQRVLSLSDKVQVLKPDALKAHIVEAAQAVIHQYQTNAIPAVNEL